jgi:hypothetical protein
MDHSATEHVLKRVNQTQANVHVMMYRDIVCTDAKTDFMALVVTINAAIYV